MRLLLDEMTNLLHIKYKKMMKTELIFPSLLRLSIRVFLQNIYY